jgi:tetratricopeptide (TPR) repeat protein
LTEETIAGYLEGVLEPALKAASEVHLISCDECRHNLTFLMRLLDEEARPDEASELQVITTEWDKRRQAAPRRTRSSWLWTIGGIAAALIIGVISLQLMLRPVAEPASATEVVQLLLSQNRPFEPRMSDQPHLPIVRTRGPGDPGVAYGLLAGEMTRLAASSHEMGRFYLLQRDFQTAIEYLRMAEREPGAPAAMHNDLGVAYLESGGEANIQKAMNEFRHALTLDLSYAPSVFNLAVLFERTGTVAEAEAQWRKFLQIESESPWSAEAKSRLEGRTR